MELGMDNLLLNAMCKAGAVFRDNHLLCGLNLAELFACHAVHVRCERNKPTQPKDLAEELEISKPAVSKLLNGLEHKGLVKRERREDDRKAVYVQLTEKAIATLSDQRATAALLTEKVFAEMGEDKAKEMLTLLDLFYDSYKKAEAMLWES